MYGVSAIFRIEQRIGISHQQPILHPTRIIVHPVVVAVPAIGLDARRSANRQQPRVRTVASRGIAHRCALPHLPECFFHHILCFISVRGGDA